MTTKVAKYAADKSIQSLKIPPSSLEAERKVIGSLLQSNKSFDDIAGIVYPEDFYHPPHQTLFEVILSALEKNNPMDMLTVTEKLSSLGLLEDAGGESYIYEVISATPTAVNIKAYAQIVKDRSVLRSVLNASSEITSLAYNTDGKDKKKYQRG